MRIANLLEGSRETLLTFLRGSGAILFIERPALGVLVLAALSFVPRAAVCGVAAALTAIATVNVAKLPSFRLPLCVYNALLVGMSLGAGFQFTPSLVALALFAGVATALLSQVLAEAMWRYERLPCMSAPFVMMSMLLAFVVRASGALAPTAPAPLSEPLLSPWLDYFFASVGSVFFAPYPLPGLILFAAILLNSPYLALLCVAGFATGHGVFELLGSLHYPLQHTWTNFNLFLAAMGLGGFYLLPGLRSFIVAMLGAALAACAVLGVQAFMNPWGLTTSAIPYLLSSWLLLAALQRRSMQTAPFLLTYAPGLPEHTYERARLARARSGDADSVPLRAPFLGSWQVYQGFEGRHTHQAPWQHALDFYLCEGDRSFRGDGAQLTDYHCYGLPVCSPCYGEVVYCVSDIPDNRPGDVDVVNNWGNLILIRLASGLHVLLAHLQQGSVCVHVGERVAPGQIIARCGNSGRSPQPHLHLHVQQTQWLGSPTVAFHLVNVLLTQDGEAPAYRLAARPSESATVQDVQPNLALGQALHLQVGRRLRYQVSQFRGSGEREVHTELTPLGQFRLYSDRDANAAFERSPFALGYFDRQGPRDAFFDLWLLAVGLTPCMGDDLRWRDAPPLHLFPNPLWRRILLSVLRPLGGGLKTDYQRSWDEASQCWIQHGVHRLTILPRVQRTVQTYAWITPQRGVERLSLRDAAGQTLINAELIATGQTEDLGIPQWSAPTSRAAA